MSFTLEADLNNEAANDNDVDQNSDHGDRVNVAWQLERQRRKVQHAQKVGRAISTLDVCYQDEHVLVVNKPGGVLTVPGVRQHAGSLLDAVHAASVDTDGLALATHRVVHRLDMDTSGLVLFGRSLEVTKRLQALFRQGRHDDQQEQAGNVLCKRYRAVVAGHWPAQVPCGMINLSLQRDIEHAPFMRVSTCSYDQRARRHLQALHDAGKQKHWVYQAAKPSQTRFTVVRRGWMKTNTAPATASLSSSCDNLDALPYTVMDLEPITGRTHQLRVHCAAVGFPIVGDPTYGWHGEAAPLGGLLSYPRTVESTPISMLQAWNDVHPPNVAPLCLHAAFLEVPHPCDENKMISCSAPAPFDALFEPCQNKNDEKLNI